MSLRSSDWPARLDLHPTAWVAPGAVVVGEVKLAARSSVWFNTVVRGDTDRIEVGEDSNLQDNSTVHNDEGQPALIGARVTVGHRAIIHGCVIEDDCLIGMGSVVLSGARIGTGSLIGAASLVREGQVIPPGSLALGSPARVIGPVNDAHREAIARGSRHYAELARSYMARGHARPHPAPNSDAGITDRVEGPMRFLEWGQRLMALSETLSVAAGALESAGEAHWMRPPAAGRWSAHQIAWHLYGCDVEVFLPRLERLLTESLPTLENVDLRPWDASQATRGRDTGELMEAWRGARERLLARLAPLRPADWARTGIHSVRGPYTVADHMRMTPTPRIQIVLELQKMWYPNAPEQRLAP